MIFYFGTSLDSKGHFFWQVEDDHIISKGLSFPKGSGISLANMKHWPFNPEDMPKEVEGKGRTKGNASYYRENGYTICAIEGSCLDDRPGTKTVFFTDEKLRFGEFAVKLTTIPIIKKIIQKMPFKVQWNLNQEYTDKLQL